MDRLLSRPTALRRPPRPRAGRYLLGCRGGRRVMIRCRAIFGMWFFLPKEHRRNAVPGPQDREDDDAPLDAL